MAPVKDIPLEKTPQGRTPLQDNKRKASPGSSPFGPLQNNRRIRLNASSSSEEDTQEEENEMRATFKKVTKKMTRKSKPGPSLKKD